jgi:hypothetical protein
MRLDCCPREAILKYKNFLSPAIVERKMGRLVDKAPQDYPVTDSRQQNHG